MEERDIALSKAKIQLMSRPDSAFFTTILFSLRFRWDETHPTAYTDGTWLGINPKWFMGLSSEERVFLLIHEAMHVAYMHMLRLGERDPQKWNHAADYVINLMLIERGFIMPKDGLLDHAYKGMSTEEVYNKLPEKDRSKIILDLKEPTEQTDSVQREIEDILVRASIQSKMQNDAIGTIPGEIAIFLEKLLNPKLPWQRILQKYMNNMAKNDYSFRKPNRRYFPKYHLPSMYSEKLMNIAIAVDASGSVSDAEFLRFISETNGILKMMKPDKITLVQFDTEIKSVDEVKSVQELSKVKFSGRGGTLISPVIQWANENKPQLLLVFSDGQFRFYEYPTKIPVVWLIHGKPDFTAPYGKVIHYEM